MTELSPLLMEAQMRAEWEMAHAPALAELERYRLALGGIASCATQCVCCRLHVEVALRALTTLNPTTTDPAGTSRLTNAFAPITAPAPTVIPPITTAPA
jgi:hypothetical protein